jgi:methionyl-tRNA formyltransferase
MNNKKVQTIFIGAGNFAVKILENLLKSDSPLSESLEVVAIVTQPDKIAGRKKELTPPAVKQYLLDYTKLLVSSVGSSIPLLQPVKLRNESAEILEKFKPELIIVADYGQMVPNDIIDFPKYKCLNIHGSILPNYRGAVPAAAAILNGDKKTGVSIPIMTYKLDDGAVIGSREIEILDTDTTYTLRMRLADIGNELLNEILPQWIKGEIEPIVQDESKATITWEKDIDKEKAQITKFMKIEIVERMIRAYSPWPIAWANVEVNKKLQRLKIYKAKIVDEGSVNPAHVEVGEIFKDNKKLYLTFEDGILELLEVQLEGKKVLEGKDYLFLDGIKLTK